MYYKNKLIFTFIHLITCSLAFGQGQGNSAYNTVGIGSLADESNAAQDMMGGTGASFSNTFYANQINPALLVKNRVIGFNKYVAFNVGMKGNYKTITQGNKIQQDFGMNLSNLTFIFPIYRKWATAVSFKPYSLADNISVGKKTFAGTNTETTTEFSSKGGLSQVAFNNSFQVAKGLYWGIEGQYLFGNISRDTTSTIAKSAEYFRYTGRYDLNGFSVKTGLATQVKLNSKWFFNIGAAYQLGSNLKGETLRVFSVLGESSAGPTYIQAPDTISINKIASQTPQKLRAGISFESPYHWILAADYSVTQWAGKKQFENRANTYLKNSTEYNVGLEWLPKSSSSRYLDQVFYRVGYRQIQMPFSIANTSLSDKSLSFGLSLPLGYRSPSYIDLGVAVGRRGTAASGLIQENYTKISVNFSLLSSWFYKPKIE